VDSDDPAVVARLDLVRGHPATELVIVDPALDGELGRGGFQGRGFHLRLCKCGSSSIPVSLIKHTVKRDCLGSRGLESPFRLHDDVLLVGVLADHVHVLQRGGLRARLLEAVVGVDVVAHVELALSPLGSVEATGQALPDPPRERRVVLHQLL
jgi:hypothetical protein